MTLTASLAWTLVRAVVLLAALGPLVPSLAAWVRGRPTRWALLAALLVFPELLVGYAYIPWVAGRPWIAEFVCALLLGARALPVAVGAWELAPPGPVTRSAIHCRGLALRTWSDRWDLVRLWFVGPIRRAIPAAGLFLLVTFQEFELAALLRAVSWTDWLFVSQVAGMTLLESLRAAAQPALCELIGLALVLFFVGILPSGGGVEESTESRPAEARTLNWEWMFIAIAWWLVILVPMMQLTAGLPAGFVQLAGQRLRWLGLMKEIAVGLSVSLTAAAIAWTLAGLLSGGRKPPGSTWRDPSGTEGSVAAHNQGAYAPRSVRIAVVTLFCLPGLLGSLILSLIVLAIFQRTWLSTLYDTPLPWVLGLTLFLAPRAVLLQVWSNALPRSAIHLSELLQASPDSAQRQIGDRLLWELRDQPRFLAVALLTYWGYLELTLAYLLAPTGMTSGVVRLYNFMHFGRTSALSAEAAVLLFTPLVGTWCLWMLWRWLKLRTT